MDLNNTFKNYFIVNLVVTTCVYFWLGTNWATGFFILIFLGTMNILWEEYQSNKNTTKPKDTSQPNNARSSTPYKPKSSSRNKSIDTINFEYKTKEGIISFYTVNVYKGINGNIEGWCHERNAVREFRKDRIINDTITRTETGEQMTTKEGRKVAMSLNK
jgi:hypothetical protein